MFIINTDNIPSKTGAIFLGYSWSNTATSPDYTYDSSSNTFTPSSITLTKDNPVRTLYAVWRYTDLSGITYMQDVTSEMCANSTTDVQYTLTDKRDNKTYTVAKLKDNKCWMTQNLALELSTSKTLTNQDTDLNNVTSWTPERNTIVPNALSSSTWANSNTDPYSYKSSTASYGVYYNWTAAVASNDSSSLTTAYSNAPDSICPKGWRLPIAYNNSFSNASLELAKIFYSYGYISNITITSGHENDSKAWTNNGFTKIQQAPISVKLSGYINGETASLQNFSQTTHFWYSTIDGAGYVASYIDIYPTYVILAYAKNVRSFGFPIRCLVY